MRRWLPPLCALALAIVFASPAVAAKGPRKTDTSWLAPDFASFDVRSIAMLPAATFDNNVDARRAAETAIGQSLRNTGYRWISALVTRDQVVREGGDSLLKAFTQHVLETGRLDSLDGPRFSRATRARALFTVRVDRFERVELEFNQSGRPATTVQLTAALVDSTGRLLWTASGSETAEGPYQDPGADGVVGVKASGLNTTPLSNQGGPPSYAETLALLLARWLPQFPARVAAPAAAPAPGN
jgi:hypothetical protein